MILRVLTGPDNDSPSRRRATAANDDVALSSFRVQ
jgi:hypothetical protein